MAECMCIRPKTCGGSGVLGCLGCGGGLCVCRCGGWEYDCPGCVDCDEVYNFDRDGADDDTDVGDGP